MLRARGAGMLDDFFLRVGAAGKKSRMNAGPFSMLDTGAMINRGKVRTGAGMIGVGLVGRSSGTRGLNGHTRSSSMSTVRDPFMPY